LNSPDHPHLQCVVIDGSRKWQRPGWVYGEAGSCTRCYPHPDKNSPFTGEYLSMPYWTFAQLEAFPCATTMTARECTSTRVCGASLSMSPLLRSVPVRRVHPFVDATIHDSSRPPMRTPRGSGGWTCIRKRVCPQTETFAVCTHGTIVWLAYQTPAPHPYFNLLSL
jgi:hypothetical protein